MNGFVLISVTNVSTFHAPLCIKITKNNNKCIRDVKRNDRNEICDVVPKNVYTNHQLLTLEGETMHTWCYNQWLDFLA
jgi:hypothetical protein